MKDALRIYLPWLLSAVTVWMTLLAGNKHRHAWLVGLGNQALWLVWIVACSAWGLLPMNAVLWVVYARNHLRWKVESELPRRVSGAKPCPRCDAPPNAGHSASCPAGAKTSDESSNKGGA